ncbi:MAG: hypothetical protein OQL08_06550 [Gammaproteobacteria bacterium]|nr:hypothetical protein [Gammaproteobacteria bacterium]
MSDDIQEPGDTQQHASRALLDELDSIKELLDDELDNAPHYSSVNDIRSVEEYLRLKQLAAGSGLSVDDYLSQQAEARPDNVESKFAIEEAAETDESEENDETDEIIPFDLYHSNEDAEVADERDQQLPDLNEEDARGDTPEEPTNPNQVGAATTEDVPLLDEVVTADEPIPLLNESVTPEEAIPLLDEVVTPEEATSPLSEVATQSALDEALSLEELQGLVDLIVERRLERLKPELQREVMAELHKLLPRTAPL